MVYAYVYVCIYVDGEVRGGIGLEPNLRNCKYIVNADIIYSIYCKYIVKRMRTRNGRNAEFHLKNGVLVVLQKNVT